MAESDMPRMIVTTAMSVEGHEVAEYLGIVRGIVVPASDLYAVGATALQLVGGRPPADWFDALNGAWRFSGSFRR